MVQPSALSTTSLMVALTPLMVTEPLKAKYLAQCLGVEMGSKLGSPAGFNAVTSPTASTWPSPYVRLGGRPSAGPPRGLPGRDEQTRQDERGFPEKHPPRTYPRRRATQSCRPLG